MNTKYLFFLSVILVTLTDSIRCNAQMTEAQIGELLLKIDASIANIKTVVYKIEHDNKLLSKRDTVHITAVCSLYIAPRDIMKAYNIVDGEIIRELESHSYIHRKYDGKRSFLTNRSIDSLNKLTNNFVDSDRRIRQSVVENYSNLLLAEYINKKKPFGRYLPSAGLLGFKEEMFHNIPVYVFTVQFKDEEDVKDNVQKHYVRKSDLLPVAFSSFLRWEGMEQYNYYEVDYLAINPNITPEDFKIAKDETLNAKERYAAFIEKIKK